MAAAARRSANFGLGETRFPAYRVADDYMNLVLRFKAWLLLVSVFGLSAVSVQAQLLDSSAGLGAGLVKLFGETKAFSARANVHVFTTNRQEVLRGPMNFALLDGRMRMEFDLAAMQGPSVPAGQIKLMSQAGLNQIASIVRLDKRVVHNVFTRAGGYIDLEITADEAQVAQGSTQVQRTPLGKETIDKHPCTKNKVVVKNAKGLSLLEATTWNASDMNEFPVQIMVQSREGTTMVRFSQVQTARPAASLFDPPARFTKHDDLNSLLVAAMRKSIPPVTKTESAPAAQPVVSSKTTASSAAASKKAAAPAKSNPAPARAGAPKTNAPAARPVSVKR